MGLVPDKDMQTPPPPPPRISDIYIGKMRTVLNRMWNYVSDFSNLYVLSYSWLYLQFTTHQVCHRPKKNCSNVGKFIQESCALLWQWFFCSGVFFCATFSFWDMVDFMHDRFWCISPLVTSCLQNCPYTKSAMSQKLKIAQKKLMNWKIIFWAMRIFPGNSAPFEQKKYLFKNLELIFASLIHSDANQWG